MVSTETPAAALGIPAPDFTLPGTDGRNWSLAQCRGPRATLVMFICNHCPYVQAIRARLVRDVRDLTAEGMRAVAIMANDPTDYPEDSFAQMQHVAAEFEFPFPYLLDATQEVARAYGAVCTPDFFGYDANLRLRYRGRLDASRKQPAAADAPRELYEAMRLIARTGTGPAVQHPSIGCSIKWRGEAA
jgi:peroxiredoxin